MKQFDMSEPRDLTGDTALVTGATSGIGAVVARWLAANGAYVFVHGRNHDRGATVVSEIIDEGGAAEFVAADFSDLDEVRELAAYICEETESLDYLFNNAGGYFSDSRPTTDVGCEYTFTVNHLAPFVLTYELRSLFGQGKPTRTVITASVAHRSSRGSFDTVDGTRNGWSAYARSKLANVLFARGLAERFDEDTLVSHAAHPGVIFESRFYTGVVPKLVLPLTRLFTYLPGIKSNRQGAETVLAACFSEESYEASGAYFANARMKVPSRVARSPDRRETLWERSESLTGIAYPEKVTERPRNSSY